MKVIKGRYYILKCGVGEKGDRICMYGVLKKMTFKEE